MVSRLAVGILLIPARVFGQATSSIADIRELADQGSAGAQLLLGLWYATGRGVTEDDEEAVRWFRMAADQGVARAQYSLGLMYANGHGVPRDYVRAYM